MAKILLVDDEESLRTMLSILLKRHGFEVTAASGVREALATLGGSETFDAVITDLSMPDGTGMDVLKEARTRSPETQVLVITAFSTTEQAVEAMRLGAYDYVEKPFKNDALMATLEKALEKRAIVEENRALRAEVRGEGFHQLLGKSAAMRDLRSKIEKVANSRTSVLITGESGTGKEMVARALHFGGPRRDRPFIVINCGALPEALMESELFGHEKGAFTGATSRKEGLFRAADSGTLFLDEVGELPAALQVKLLRVLQERSVRSVGGKTEMPVDVRVVAATNRDIEAEVAEGRFRQDLYYRLNVVRLVLPSLSERMEDIPLLAEHLLRKHAALEGRQARFSELALRWLSRQPFPGNVRELENRIERALALSGGELIEVDDLRVEGEPGADAAELFDEGEFDLDAHLVEVEKRVLLQALDKAGGVQTQAAKLLKMTFRSFRYRMAKHFGEE